MTDLTAVRAAMVERAIAALADAAKAMGHELEDFTALPAGDQAKVRALIGAVVDAIAAPQMLAALKAQHEVIDVLAATIVTQDRTFSLTRSAVWPLVLQGKAAIDAAGGGA